MNPRRTITVAALAAQVLAALVVGQTALACRCAQRELLSYYQDAEIVVAARIVSSEPLERDLVLRIETFERPYKGTVGRATRIVTATSSATCGIAIEPGAPYLLFADVEGGPARETYRVSTCNGTRRFPNLEGGEVQAYSDVPDRHVIAQLTAFAGQESLGKIAGEFPRAGDPNNDSLIGLLDVAPLAHGGFVRLREAPDTESSVLVRVDELDQLDTRGTSEDTPPAAAVYARLAGWYRLRTREGRFGWLSADSAGTYWPYDEFPIRRLSYLGAAWDGFVWPSPGAGLPTRSPIYATRERPEYAANVFESQRIGGSLWFRVEILASDPCEGGTPKTLNAGWVPGYGVGGNPTIWYHPRGC